MPLNLHIDLIKKLTLLISEQTLSPAFHKLIKVTIQKQVHAFGPKVIRRV